MFLHVAFHLSFTVHDRGGLSCGKNKAVPLPEQPCQSPICGTTAILALYQRLGGAYIKAHDLNGIGYTVDGCCDGVIGILLIAGCRC